MSPGCCGGLTVSESKDHYAVLGLDRDASEQSIKLAYRRLARENHPDLIQDRGSESLRQASELMTLINEAYRVLSNRQLRREYDISLTEEGPVSPVEPVVPQPYTPAAAAPVRRASRPDREVLASIVGVFAKQFRKDLGARAAEFKWTDRQAEGFDWAAAASFWTARYVVAVRGFSVANLENATKFTNYCNLAIDQIKHPLKQTFFLFFLAFQNSSDGPAVAALMRSFCANTNGQRTPGPACIVLTDVARGKSLVCGVRPNDSRYQELLSGLGLARQ